MVWRASARDDGFRQRGFRGGGHPPRARGGGPRVSQEGSGSRHNEIPSRAQAGARRRAGSRAVPRRVEGGFSAGYFNTVGSKEDGRRRSSDRPAATAPPRPRASPRITWTTTSARRCRRPASRRATTTTPSAPPPRSKAQRQVRRRRARPRQGRRRHHPRPRALGSRRPRLGPQGATSPQTMGWRPGKGTGRNTPAAQVPARRQRSRQRSQRRRRRCPPRRARRRRPRVRPRSEDEPPRRELRSSRRRRGFESSRTRDDALATRTRAGWAPRDPRAAKHSAWASSRRTIRRRIVSRQTRRRGGVRVRDRRSGTFRRRIRSRCTRARGRERRHQRSPRRRRARERSWANGLGRGVRTRRRFGNRGSRIRALGGFARSDALVSSADGSSVVHGATRLLLERYETPPRIKVVGRASAAPTPPAPTPRRALRSAPADAARRRFCRRHRALRREERSFVRDVGARTSARGCKFAFLAAGAGDARRGRRLAATAARTAARPRPLDADEREDAGRDAVGDDRVARVGKREVALDGAAAPSARLARFPPPPRSRRAKSVDARHRRSGDRSRTSRGALERVHERIRRRGRERAAARWNSKPGLTMPSARPSARRRRRPERRRKRSGTLARDSRQSRPRERAKIGRPPRSCANVSTSRIRSRMGRARVRPRRPRRFDRTKSSSPRRRRGRRRRRPRFYQTRTEPSRANRRRRRSSAAAGDVVEEVPPPPVPPGRERPGVTSATVDATVQPPPPPSAAGLVPPPPPPPPPVDVDVEDEAEAFLRGLFFKKAIFEDEEDEAASEAPRAAEEDEEKPPPPRVAGGRTWSRIIQERWKRWKRWRASRRRWLGTRLRWSRRGIARRRDASTMGAPPPERRRRRRRAHDAAGSARSEGRRRRRRSEVEEEVERRSRRRAGNGPGETSRAIARVR